MKKGSDLSGRSDPSSETTSKGPTPLLTNGGVGLFHTNEGCIRHELGLLQGEEIEKVCSIHAEALAIAKAAKNGVSLDGATAYVTSFPCLICMRSIVAAGIKKVFYMNDFYKLHDMELFEKNGVEVEQL
jgi:dCMP deaminase